MSSSLSLSLTAASKRSKERRIEMFHNSEIKALQTLHDATPLQGNKLCRKDGHFYCVIILPKHWCTLTAKQNVLYHVIDLTDTDENSRRSL